MQIIFKSDHLLTISTSTRIYPTNTALEVTDEELARLETAFKDTPNLEILKRPSKFSADDSARLDSIVSNLIGKPLDAQKALVSQAFEELSPQLRQELRSRIMIAALLSDDLKRKLPELLESVEVWERSYGE